MSGTHDQLLFHLELPSQSGSPVYTSPHRKTQPSRLDVVLTGSSTNTFPRFFPRGASTPTGVIILSFGSPSSFSVYTLCFFFPVPLFCLVLVDFVFCWLGGGRLGFFDIRLFETPVGLRPAELPLMPLRELPLLPPRVGLEEPLLGAMVVV